MLERIRRRAPAAVEPVPTCGVVKERLVAVATDSAGWPEDIQKQRDTDSIDGERPWPDRQATKLVVREIQRCVDGTERLKSVLVQRPVERIQHPERRDSEKSEEIKHRI